MSMFGGAGAREVGGSNGAPPSATALIRLAQQAGGPSTSVASGQSAAGGPGAAAGTWGSAAATSMSQAGAAYGAPGSSPASSPVGMTQAIAGFGSPRPLPGSSPYAMSQASTAYGAAGPSPASSPYGFAPPASAPGPSGATWASRPAAEQRDDRDAAAGGLLSGLFSGFFCGSSAASEAKLEVVLSELHLSLQNATRELRSASEGRKAAVCARHVKSIRRADREAAALLATLPSSAPTAAILAERQQELHHQVARLEADCRPYMKEPPQAESTNAMGAALMGGPGSEARTLALRLDDLALSLERLESGGLNEADAQRVDRASAEYEEFRVGSTGDEGPEDTAKKGAALLRSLRGTSRWYDVNQVQQLIRQRNEYLAQYRFRAAHDMLDADARSKTEAAKQFLANHEDWEDTLKQTLGPHGMQDWRFRAARVIHQQEANEAARGGIPDSGALIIRRIKAHHLRKADMWDDSDPYVVFNHRGREQMTPVVWNQNSPEWRVPGRTDDKDDAWQEVSFDINGLQQDPILRVFVKDYDRFSKDDNLGNVDEGFGGINLIDVFTGRSSSSMSRPAPKDANGAPEAKTLLEDASMSMSTGGLPRVEARGKGTVHCHFFLKGDGAGGGGASIEFELIYDTTGSHGDPLVLLPEAEDKALHIVGEADHATGVDREAFGAVNVGFFLAGAPSASSGDSMKIPREVFDEVWEYNRMLDRLSMMTTHPNRTGMQHTGARHISDSGTREEMAEFIGVFSEEALHDYQHFVEDERATQTFRQLLSGIQAVELRVQDDPMRMRAFTFQEQVLPSIGEWSQERRRVLRNQVFLAQRHLSGVAEHRSKVLCPQGWLPVLIGAVLLVYATSVVALVFGGQWQHRDELMIGASVAVIILIAVAIYMGSSEFFAGQGSLRGAKLPPRLAKTFSYQRLESA